MDRIELTEKVIDGINASEIIAIALADGGAMGDPGAIMLVDKKLKKFCTHFGIIDDKKLVKVIPFLEKIKVDFDKVTGLDKDWDYIYTGFGNYLFIRPELKDPILKYVEENYKDPKLPTVARIYGHWYEALKNIKMAP